MPTFSWLPADQAGAEDIEAVFATGGARTCRCQAMKVPGWIWRDTTQEEREAAQLRQTGCGATEPVAEPRTGPLTVSLPELVAVPTTGLIGYVDGEAAGWVAVEPRENYPRLWARKQAWMRRDPDLEGVWSVTCFVVRKGWRHSGLTYELAAAAVAHGEQQGAHVLEGYPIEPAPGKTVVWDEASVGLVQVFLEAGFEVVASPTLRRRVVRRVVG